MKLCSIASGSSGNCTFVGSAHTSLLIDAGISGRRTLQGLQSLGYEGADIDGILVTHEHIDHIKGLGVLARKLGVPIYATRGTLEAVCMCRSLGEIPDGILYEIEANRGFSLGDLHIHPFAISHDAADPVGYRIGDGRSSVGIATDLGTYDEHTIAELAGLDALLLEANHDVNMLEVGSYPYYLKQRIMGSRGHLSNCSAGHLLCALLHDKMKAVLLGHLSKENNYEALALETVREEVDLGDNPYKSADFDIRVAKRDEVSGMIEC